MAQIVIKAPPQRILPLDEGIGEFIVHGKKATSIEYRVAQALDKLEVEYIFQVSYLGGRALRGGLVLDFLAFTVPLSTPIWVNGEYWHSGRRKIEDILQQVTLDFYMHGRMNKAVILWGKDLQSEEQALAAVRRELRL